MGQLVKPKPLTAWYGGKAMMAKKIAAMLPPHKIYCEPFGGMAGVLMAKEPSKVEIYNDLHDGVVCLFRVVRDPAKCQKLLEQLELTPYARNEWRHCNNTWEDETDEIEKARKVYVTLQQNFVGATKNGSWSFGGPKYSGSVVTEFYNSFENIKRVCQRLKEVQIENQPALTLIARWDNPETCFYLDPPYLPETRHKGQARDYKHEMNHQDHLDFLGHCLQLKGMAILSGYPSELYNSVLCGAGWTCREYKAQSSAALQSNANGLKGKPRDVAKRTEALWFSPNIAKPAQLQLFEELAG